MRTLTVVGRIGLRFNAVARRCAWCGSFYRIRDRLFAALGGACSDGCCDGCIQKLMEDA